jgi:hypothetical protein
MDIPVCPTTKILYLWEENPEDIVQEEAWQQQRGNLEYKIYFTWNHFVW